MSRRVRLLRFESSMVNNLTRLVFRINFLPMRSNVLSYLDVELSSKKGLIKSNNDELERK